MSRRFGEHLKGNIVGYVALFVSLSGVAWAANGPLQGKNTVGSADIIDTQVKSDDIGHNQVRGDDILESSLGTVPTALRSKVGGVNAYNSAAVCDPENETYLPCVVVTLNLPVEAKVLVVGRITALAEDGETAGAGTCQIGSTAGSIPGSRVLITADDDIDLAPNTFLVRTEHVALNGVTGTLPAGTHSFGIDCSQTNVAGAQIYFVDAGVSATALSAD